MQAAAQRMNARNVGTLVLLDEEKRPIGLLTDRDLTVRVLAKGRDALQPAVGDVITTCLQTVRESTHIEDALSAMRSGHCHRLPVVDHNGQLVGILSVDDVLQLVISEFHDLDALLREESPRSLESG